jgi:hypothetical protein
MGFWAYLHDDRGHEEFCENYTHNCNGMANIALDSSYEQMPVGTEVLMPPDGHKSWWQQLDGLSGCEGAELLSRIITTMEAEPERFRLLNPDNGWGDFDTFLVLLRSMHKASLVEWPTIWTVHG